MTVALNSYIAFKDNAREAMEYYKSIFGGEIHMDTFEKFADSMPVEEADKDKIMHAYLKGDNGIELMAADTPSGMEFHEGARLSLTLSGDDEALLRSYWGKLVEGGMIAVPLEKAPWSDVFGMVIDKYGVSWMIDIGPVQS